MLGALEAYLRAHPGPGRKISDVPCLVLQLRRLPRPSKGGKSPTLFAKEESKAVRQALSKARRQSCLRGPLEGRLLQANVVPCLCRGGFPNLCSRRLHWGRHGAAYSSTRRYNN